MLMLTVVYIVAVLGEAVWMKVPLSELARIFSYLLGAFLVSLTFLTGLYIGTFFVYFFQESSRAGCIFTGRRRAMARLDIASRNYIEGDRFIWGCFGFLALMPDNFFFIVKSLVHYINPYSLMKWDFVFARWDKALTFGHYPTDLLIPAVNAVPGLAHVLDICYAFWFIVMVLVTGYCVFVERSIHRRLRYLSVYLLCWILFGSLAATVLSSVGPLFFHDFFPDVPDPYAIVPANLSQISAHSSFFAAEVHAKLLYWTKSDVMFNPNAIAAMPSMHVGIAWLMMLYLKQINRVWFALSAAFCGFVFLATVYFGIHYAVDSYVMVPCVGFLWWAAGKVLDRRYKPDELLKASA